MNKNNSYLMFLTLVATLGGLLFGYDTAVISGTVKYLDLNFVAPLGLSETAASSLLGFAVSSALIGCVLGGMVGGVVASALGRKRGLMIAAVLFIISAVGSAYPEMGFPHGAPHTFLTQFIIYRIIGGVGVGLASMLSPMYIAEMAPASRRGGLVAWNQFAIIFGMLVVYFVNYFIALNGDEAWLTSTGWRLMFLSEVIPAALLFLLVLGVPESPPLADYEGPRSESGRLFWNGSMAPLKLRSRSAKYPPLLRGTVKAKLFSYGVGVDRDWYVALRISAVYRHQCGTLYAPEIFRNMGMGTNAALAQTIIVGVINLSFTVLAIFTVDRFGRRPLMIIGSLGMAVSMVTLGMTFFLEQMGFLSLLAMLCYVASFAVSWGPICWVLLAEIFPNKIRSQAMALAVAAQWVANYLVSWTFPMMDKSTYLNGIFHHAFAYWIYALMAVLAALFMWRFVPETKGRPLEEMEKLFAEK
ncbi:MAG: D-xylose transporter XylE [Alistipes indistinctus]